MPSPRCRRRLDGTGATVVRLVDELLGRIDEAAAPLADRHAREVAELEARIELLGERGSGRKLLEDRHKRELRRHRTDELRSGLAVLAATYRDLLVGGDSHRPESLVAAVTRIHEALAALRAQPERGAAPPVAAVVAPGGGVTPSVGARNLGAIRLTGPSGRDRSQLLRTTPAQIDELPESRRPANDDRPARYTASPAAQIAQSVEQRTRNA